MKKENVIKIIVIAAVILIIFGIFIYKNSTKFEIDKIENTQSNSENNVSIYFNEKSLPTLLDFGSTTCEPCKTMFPILDSIEEKYEEKLIVKFINVYTDYKTTQKYNIRTIPTQIFLDSEGKVLYRHEGVMYEDDIIKKLKQLGVN